MAMDFQCLLIFAIFPFSGTEYWVRVRQSSWKSATATRPEKIQPPDKWVLRKCAICRLFNFHSKYQTVIWTTTMTIKKEKRGRKKLMEKETMCKCVCGWHKLSSFELYLWIFSAFVKLSFIACHIQEFYGILFDFLSSAQIFFLSRHFIWKGLQLAVRMVCFDRTFAKQSRNKGNKSDVNAWSHDCMIINFERIVSPKSVDGWFWHRGSFLVKCNLFNSQMLNIQLWLFLVCVGCAMILPSS